jgi:hypothetical protein
MSATNPQTARLGGQLVDLPEAALPRGARRAVADRARVISVMGTAERAPGVDLVGVRDPGFVGAMSAAQPPPATIADATPASLAARPVPPYLHAANPPNDPD